MNKFKKKKEVEGVGGTGESFESYKRNNRPTIDDCHGSAYQSHPDSALTMFDDFENLHCGAKTKSTGNPCKRKDIYANGRCKLHGGLSTGPKTVEGKRKSALNGLKAKSMRRSRKAQG